MANWTSGIKERWRTPRAPRHRLSLKISGTACTSEVRQTSQREVGRKAVPPPVSQSPAGNGPRFPHRQAPAKLLGRVLPSTITHARRDNALSFLRPKQLRHTSPRADHLLQTRENPVLTRKPTQGPRNKSPSVRVPVGSVWFIH